MKYYFEDHDIDPGFLPYLRKLNELGFSTYSCCSGLLKDHDNMEESFSPYIFFDLTDIDKHMHRSLINTLEKVKIYAETQFTAQKTRPRLLQCFFSDPDVISPFNWYNHDFKETRYDDGIVLKKIEELVTILEKSRLDIVLEFKDYPHPYIEDHDHHKVLLTLDFE